MLEATKIELTLKTKEILKKIIRQAKCPQNLAKRIKIILMAADNSKISRKLEIDRGIVRKWRNRWKQEQNFWKMKIIELNVFSCQNIHHG